jgi:nicotinamide-nucleotide amidase
MTDLKTDILTLSRQSSMKPLDPWFDAKLDTLIAQGVYADVETLETKLLPHILKNLSEYRIQNNLETTVLGMSGGVDSALTARLMKKAGWTVKGYTLPIYQDPHETRRGVDACLALGIHHEQIDLSDQYDTLAGKLGEVDDSLRMSVAVSVRIRLGNLRARLRMMTLYDQAARFGGIVASTDNISEMSAGFWTICGDVGDISPVQSLLKSWEVPALSRMVGVPEEIWKAKPTDGLGIDDGDEAQLGASYLEWDLMLLHLMDCVQKGQIPTAQDFQGRAHEVFEKVTQRMGRTWHKRFGPVRLPHVTENRYQNLDALDTTLFHPDVIKSLSQE